MMEKKWNWDEIHLYLIILCKKMQPERYILSIGVYVQIYPALTNKVVWN